MKPNGVNPYLAVAIVVALLSSSFAAPTREHQANVRAQAAQQQRPAGYRSEVPIQAGTRPEALAQPRASRESTLEALAFAANSSVTAFRALPPTVLEGMPYRIWCMLHPRDCWLNNTTSSHEGASWKRGVEAVSSR